MVPVDGDHPSGASQPARVTGEDVTLVDVKVPPNRGGTMARSSRRGRAVAAVITGLVGGCGGMFALFAASATPAFADSSAYELYCPGTPVGNIALNGVVTTGTITPAVTGVGLDVQPDQLLSRP